MSNTSPAWSGMGGTQSFSRVAYQDCSLSLQSLASLVDPALSKATHTHTSILPPFSHLQAPVLPNAHPSPLPMHPKHLSHPPARTVCSWARAGTRVGAGGPPAPQMPGSQPQRRRSHPCRTVPCRTAAVHIAVHVAVHRFVRPVQLSSYCQGRLGTGSGHCQPYLCGPDGGAHQLGNVALVLGQQVQLAAMGVELLKDALVVLQYMEYVHMCVSAQASCVIHSVSTSVLVATQASAA